MNRNWFCVASLFLLISNVYADTCIPTKRVAFDDFMYQSLSVSVPLTLLVPAEYELAKLEAPVSYSYWMTPDGAKAVGQTHDLPKSTGYMYGKLSLSVGYDATTDSFAGMENFKAEAEAQGFVVVSVSKQKINGHTILFTEVKPKGENRTIYAMYVALNLSTNTAYLAYVPPRSDPDQNECFWKELKEGLGSSPTSSNPSRSSLDSSPLHNTAR